MNYAKMRTFIFLIAVKILPTQCIGTFKSAYTLSHALNSAPTYKP